MPKSEIVTVIGRVKSEDVVHESPPPEPDSDDRFACQCEESRYGERDRGGSGEGGQRVDRGWKADGWNGLQARFLRNARRIVQFVETTYTHYATAAAIYLPKPHPMGRAQKQRADVEGMSILPFPHSPPPSSTTNK